MGRRQQDFKLEVLKLCGVLGDEAEAVANEMPNNWDAEARSAK